MANFGTRWESIESFREGGQAHTFKVKDKNAADDEIYILKRLKNPKREGRFDREIEACLSLNHPNILQIVDYGKTEKNIPYFVSEYCERGNLGEQEMPLRSLVETVELFRKICVGIAHAHEKGIVHRDIKPENIFLRSDGNPVVGTLAYASFKRRRDG